MALAEIHPDMHDGSREPHELSVPLYPLHGEEDISLTTYRDRVHAAGTVVRCTIDVPDVITDDTPCLIIPGFGGSEPAYAKLRGEIALSGRVAATYRPPRTRGLSFAPDGSPERLQSKAAYAVTKRLHELYPDTQVDLVTHSMGGWLGAGIALHKPDKIRSLTLISSAGLTEHNLLKLTPGAINMSKNLLLGMRNGLPFEITPDTVIEALSHFVRNPVRTSGEALAVGTCNIRDTIPALGKLGVRVAILQLEHDELFKESVVAEIAKDLTQHYGIIPGLGHAGPITHPTEVAAATVAFLETMYVPS